MDFKEEMEKLTDVSKENIDPGEKLGDIQWLRAKYKLVLEREETLLRYLDNKLGIIDHRLDSLEEKVGDG